MSQNGDTVNTGQKYVKLLINAPGPNRDPMFIGDPASFRTLASSHMRLEG